MRDPTSAAKGLAPLLGALGRWALRFVAASAAILAHLGGISHLLARSVAASAAAPFSDVRRLLPKQLFPMMRNVGVRSLPIVSLISFLMGAILVLQTGELLRQLSQLQQVPGAVALSLTREISPLMTAIIMTARVGASYTAVLGSMKINEELLALRTMGIELVGYLVAPRLIAMVVMVPCLTVLSYVLGMVGGAAVARGAYGIGFELYANKTFQALDMTDLTSGLAKSCIFAILITAISCHFGLETEGGSVGLGRYIMVAVVTCLVAVIVADALATGVINNYIL